MKIWLLYDDCDFRVNRDFARMFAERGKTRGVDVEAVVLSELMLGMDETGRPFCLRNGKAALPEAVFSRQRNNLISEHFERMGIPVFNHSRVCAICNDKRATLQFLQGLPMPKTHFVTHCTPLPNTTYPVILKPACSHGGDRVTLVHNEAEWHAAAAAIHPEPFLQQEVVTDAGKDLRVYVLNGRILAGVMRTAQSGVVSNFKKGGHVALHKLTSEERALANEVIRRFAQADAPLILAGVDFLYDHGHPVIGEVEDVVGSRMLYQTSEIDIVSLYLDEIEKFLSNRK